MNFTCNMCFENGRALKLYPSIAFEAPNLQLKNLVSYLVFVSITNEDPVFHLISFDLFSSQLNRSHLISFDLFSPTDSVETAMENLMHALAKEYRKSNKEMTWA